MASGSSEWRVHLPAPKKHAELSTAHILAAARRMAERRASRAGRGRDRGRGRGRGRAGPIPRGSIASDPELLAPGSRSRRPRKPRGRGRSIESEIERIESGARLGATPKSRGGNIIRGLPEAQGGKQEGKQDGKGGNHEGKGGPRGTHEGKGGPGGQQEGKGGNHECEGAPYQIEM